MPALTCQLSLYPDYLHREMGLDFSDRYHLDPVYRNEKWNEVLRWSHARFGRWGCGAEDPPDSYSVTTLPSVHLFAHLFGSKVAYYENAFPDTHDYPLKDLPDLRDFSRETETVRSGLARMLDATRQLADSFGPERVAIPFYVADVLGMRDVETSHCPLTIAYRLFGSRLFLEMCDDPEGVEHVFGEILRLSLEVGAALREVLGRPRPESALVGGCAATLIGPDHFRRHLLPLIARYADGRPLVWHSCGDVNGLMEAFGELHATSRVVVFDCREQAGIDLRAAVAAFPGATISYMLSPAACLARCADDVRRAVRSARELIEESDLHMILNLPAGSGDEIVDAFFETGVELGARLPEQAGLAFL